MQVRQQGAPSQLATRRQGQEYAPSSKRIGAAPRSDRLSRDGESVRRERPMR